MKKQILGMLAVALLAGPMAANATVTYTFEFTDLLNANAGVGTYPDFTIALTYSDFVTTTGMNALGVSLPTTLGYDVLNAGTNNSGQWAFSNNGGSISDFFLTFSDSTFIFTPTSGPGGYYTSVGSYSGVVYGNAPSAFDGTALLTITSAVPLPAAGWLLLSGLGGLGLMGRRRKAV